MTALTRRAFAAGAAVLATVPALPAAAQGTASRSFRFFRGSTPIGTNTMTVARGPAGVTATGDIDIVVKGLGFIPLYRYVLDFEEVYDAEGTLVSMRGTCDDDGEPHFVNVAREGSSLLVNGSRHAGPVPVSAGVASYWRRDAIERTPWISTQSGLPLAISVSPIRSAEAPAGASAFRATNGTDFTIDLFYDSRGEWVGGAFDAKGARATMRMISETGPLPT